MSLSVVECALYLLVSDHLHQQYHVDGSWLEQFDWFMRRRERHFYHHYHMKRNMSLGGMDSTVDRLLHTYVQVKQKDVAGLN